MDRAVSSRIRIGAALVVAITALGGEPTLAQTTECISVDSNGAAGDFPSDIPSLSADGRFAAFHSDASNLVANDTNGFTDVFVRDRLTGTTERASISTAGAQGNSSSRWSSISADGRFVAFYSFASNLAAGDTNGATDVYVRDRASGTTQLISVSTAGVLGNSQSDLPAISADGRFVTFQSFASNLVAGDTNAVSDVFVRDRQTGTTERVSVASSGAQGNAFSDRTVISADGRFIAFHSLASNLVVNDTNAVGDIFVRDRALATTERVSLGPAGAQANGQSDSASISAQGGIIAFTSAATNLAAGANGGVFVRDRVNGTTELVSVTSTGAATGGDQFNSISADGRFVAFWSGATNVVPGDTNGAADIFLRDRLSGTTELVSVGSTGVQGNNHSYGGEISANGRFVAFVSEASNFVSPDNNGENDVFVHDRGAVTPASYCTAGTTSSGCNATIAANAHPSVSFANACHITVTNVEGQKTGIVFYGLQRLSQPWCSQGAGTSVLCVKAPTTRTGVHNSGGTFGACNGSLSLDWNAFQLANPSALGAPWSAGTTADVQAWFRDPPSCKTTSLSNAVELLYLP